MIDLKQELKNFSYIDLKSLPENGEHLPENIKNSIVLYNKALDNLYSRSEDIAIIELKKAVSLNPEFYEAMNLLGVCYTFINDNKRAAEIFDKVIKSKKNSTDAQRLLNTMGLGEASASENGSGEYKASEEKKAVDNRINNKLNKSKNTYNFKLLKKIRGLIRRDAVKFSLGFVAGALLTLLLSLAFYPRKTSTPVSNTDDDQKKIISSLNNSIDSLKQQLNEMNDKYDVLEKLKSDSDNQIDYYKNVMKFFEIETLASEGKFETAADKLLLIKDAGFIDGEKKKYDDLCNNILPKAAWNVYNEGMNRFWAKKYQDALGKLAKVQLYKGDLPYLDSTFYNMGVCYKNLEDSRKALDMFQKVIDSYPNSRYSLYSQARINEITGRP